jgi:hypothetical protein
MIRHTPKNILSIIFCLALWMRRGEFCAEIGRDDFSPIWIIPCAITVGWLPKKSQMRSLNDCPAQLILRIWVRATFGSLECWRETWRIEHSRLLKKLWRPLHWSGMEWHSKSSRASCSNGLSVLSGSFRTEENITSPDIKRFIESSLGSEIAGGLRTFCPPCIWFGAIKHNRQGCESIAELAAKLTTVVCPSMMGKRPR